MGCNRELFIFLKFWGLRKKEELLLNNKGKIVEEVGLGKMFVSIVFVILGRYVY